MRGLGRDQTRSTGTVLAPARQPVAKKVAWPESVGTRPSRIEDGTFPRSSCDTIFEEHAHVDVAGFIEVPNGPLLGVDLASGGGPSSRKLFIHP